MNPRPSRLPGESATPAKTVLCAIGDIHGRLDLLARATQQLRQIADEAAAGGKRFAVVFLGDYIDRGSDTRGVLDHLIDFGHTVPFPMVFLRGNHEQILLDIVDEGRSPDFWLDFGGLETLSSYGLQRSSLRSPKEAGQAIRAAMPEGHLAFLRDTESHVKYGDYVFVHAGLRPDRMLEEQSVSDMLWFRYYADETPVHGYTVVHGHSPSSSPINSRSRIGIDTEAYASNALTIVRLEDTRRDFLKVSLPKSGEPADVGVWQQIDAAYAPRESEVPTFEAPRPAPPPPQKRPARRVGLLKGVGVLVLVLMGFVGLMLAWPLLNKPNSSHPAIARSLAKAPARPAANRELRNIPPLVEATPHSAPARSSPPPVLPGGASTSSPPPAAAPPPPPPPPPVAQSPTTAPSAAQVLVQLAAVPSSAAAEDVWKRAAAQFPDQMKSKSLVVEPTTANGVSLYRANVAGFDSLESARSFCTTVRAAGGACLVRTPLRGARP